MNIFDYLLALVGAVDDAITAPSGLSSSSPPPQPPPSTNNGQAADARLAADTSLRSDLYGLYGLDGLDGLNAEVAQLQSDIDAVRATTYNELLDLKNQYDSLNISPMTSTKAQQLQALLKQGRDILTEQHNLSVEAHNTAKSLVQQYANTAPPGAIPPPSVLVLGPLLGDLNGTLLEGPPLPPPFNPVVGP